MSKSRLVNQKINPKTLKEMRGSLRMGVVGIFLAFLLCYIPLFMLPVPLHVSMFTSTTTKIQTTLRLQQLYSNHAPLGNDDLSRFVRDHRDEIEEDYKIVSSNSKVTADIPINIRDYPTMYPICSSFLWRTERRGWTHVLSPIAFKQFIELDEGKIRHYFETERYGAVAFFAMFAVTAALALSVVLGRDFGENFYAFWRWGKYPPGIRRALLIYYCVSITLAPLFSLIVWIAERLFGPEQVVWFNFLLAALLVVCNVAAATLAATTSVRMYWVAPYIVGQIFGMMLVSVKSCDGRMERTILSKQSFQEKIFFWIFAPIGQLIALTSEPLFSRKRNSS